jgi:hypothetical protein
MNRKHALAIPALLGLAIAAGAFAATRDGAASGETTPASSISLAEENARLDRYEATLDRLLDRARRGAGANGSGLASATAPTGTQAWDDDLDDDSGHGSDDDEQEDDDSGRGSDDDDHDDSGHGSDEDEHEDDD